MRRTVVAIVSPVLSMAILAIPALAQDATPTAALNPSAPVEVKVDLGDFFVKPLTADFVAGIPYEFQVTNTGKATHEFIIEPKGAVDKPLAEEENGKAVESEVEDIAPGQTKTLMWTFQGAGDYTMACHVPGHFEAGMKTEFKVAAEAKQLAAAPSTADTISVHLADFMVKPSTTTLHAGKPYLISVTNDGAITHELVIEPAGKVDKPLESEQSGKDVESEVENIAPGETKTLQWTFDQPGQYQMACHVPGHFEAGMKVAFQVVP